MITPTIYNVIIIKETNEIGLIIGIAKDNSRVLIRIHEKIGKLEPFKLLSKKDITVIGTL